MDESVRTIIVPDASNNAANMACACNNSIAAMLPAILQNRGLDSAGIMSILANRGNGGFFGNNGGFQDIIALIVIAAIFGNGNFGGIFGGNGNNGNALGIEGREMIMQTLNRNGVDIAAIANALNVSTDRITDGINAVSQAICNLGAQNAQSFNQVLTAMLQGNNALTSQIASCCCDIKTLIQGVNTTTERGFASLGYELRDQTCELQKTYLEGIERVIAGQRAAEMREMQRELAERDRTIAKQDVIINNGQQTAIFSQMIGQAVAPVAAALQNLQTDVNGIKCKLPETATIPYSPVTGIPTCVAAQYGLFGLNGLGTFNNGFWG